MNYQVSTSSVSGNHQDADYAGFLSRIQARFLANLEAGSGLLFTTNAENLWNLYLNSFADAFERQHHNCHACRHFIERFGSLVTIDEAGRATSAVWSVDDAPEAYKAALAAMAKAVRQAKITGVFLSSDGTWGTAKTGKWHHLSVTPPAASLHTGATQTAGQRMAEKREDFKTVMTALGEFTQAHLDTALTLLKSDALYRSEKVLGAAEWLHALHVARAAARGDAKANLVWRAVAKAPAGFCHPRSSMIGTLLEDIAAGLSFENVSRRFADKMHPLAYQRPQAAPSAGVIAAAEKVLEQLGAAGSLARRFARVDEIQKLWQPTPKKETAPVGGGVFSHLLPQETKPSSMAIPAQTMTWDKFQRTVLPTAERLEFQAPHSGAYVALVTAVNADAPPILQWDSAETRNPVSWYFWSGGSPASQFGLTSGEFVEVEAVTLKPSMWNGGFAHQGVGVMFVLAGARESKANGAMLFPEIMKSEFHGIRSVIEAYSRKAKVEGMGEAHAAGVMLTNNNTNWDAVVRVWSGGRSSDYRLDRWD